MNLEIRKGDLCTEDCDVLVVSVLEDGGEKSGGATDVDNAMEGELKEILKEEDFKGKLGSTMLVRPHGEVAAKRVIVVGLGKKNDLTHESVRQAAAAALARAKALKAKTVHLALLGLDGKDVSARVAGQAITEGLLLSNYAFTRYKKEKGHKIEEVHVLCRTARDATSANKGADLGRAYAEGTIFARELVNTPGEHMKPKDLVDAAKEVAKGTGEIRVKVIDQEGLEKMGAGGMLAINQGSDHEPYLVHMIYKPKGKAKKKVALVGKAVTFDTGGLSLKPSSGMQTMKLDMAGSAAVLGAFHAIAAVAPKAEVHGIFGAVENMPSGRAIRPGDVATALNGKTIEILNTDAEGRVTMADTLSYAVKQKPDMMIDLATLTGSCVVALGEEITGLMGNDQPLADKVLNAADSAGEKMWQLPLEENYAKLLKSDIADLKNIGGRWGGTLTAGLFLKEFVSDVPWVHLDIAGPSYAERKMNAYMRKGATGHGVRTLLEFLRKI